MGDLLIVGEGLLSPTDQPAQLYIGPWKLSQAEQDIFAARSLKALDHLTESWLAGRRELESRVVWPPPMLTTKCMVAKSTLQSGDLASHAGEGLSYLPQARSTCLEGLFSQAMAPCHSGFRFSREVGLYTAKRLQLQGERDILKGVQEAYGQNMSVNSMFHTKNRIDSN